MDFWQEDEEGSLALKLILAMSDEELAGQLFMISYPSTDPDETAIQWIEERNLGGIKIFGKREAYKKTEEKREEKLFQM